MVIPARYHMDALRTGGSMLTCAGESPLRLSVFLRFAVFLCVFALSVAVPPMPAHAATIYYVGSTNGGSTTTSCATLTNTTCTLRGALSLAVSGDIVRFGTGFPSVGVIDVRTGSSGGVGIALTTSVAIDGNGRNPILDGGRLAMTGTPVQVLGLTSGVTATLTALTIRNGQLTGANGGGSGGIYNNGGTLTLVNTTLSGNYAFTSGNQVGFGGAILNTGTLTLTNSTVANNQATQGGGIFNNSGILTLTNSIVSGNHSQGVSGGNGGGGIYQVGNMLTITNSAITDNISEQNGGGIYSSFSTATITDSTISSNVAAGYGGGIEKIGGTLTLTNSTVSGNRVQNNAGGGIDNVGTAFTLTNSTVVNNVATTSGRIGGISNDTGAFTLTNSIVAYNGSTASSAASAGDHNLVVATLTGFDTTLRDNGGPTLTHAITTASPAYGTGNLTACQSIAVPGAGAIDQRGAPRVVGSGASAACSIGAFEPGLVRSVTTLTVSPLSPVPAGQLVTLTARADGIIGGTPGDGTIAFGDGAMPLASLSYGGSTVTFNTATLIVGTHSLTAQYAGGSVYAASISPAQSLTVQPRVDAISPTSGDLRGGALVTISGAGFVPGNTTVQFGTDAATVETTTSTLLTLRTPPHIAGIVDVTVSVNGQATTRTGAYTFGSVAPVPTPLRPSLPPVTPPPPPAPARRTPGSGLGAGTPTPAPAPTRRSG